MIELKNGVLTAKFSEIGAELKSLMMDGKEYIWPGHPDIWKSSCPLLFPVCGNMKEGKYTYKGKEYPMTRHGIVRTREFAVESLSDTRVVFLHKSDEETRTMYPFDYELRVVYTLLERSLQIGYMVKNLTGDTMYFSIGSHEGYLTPEGVEDYDVLFPQKETLDSYVLSGPLLTDVKVPIIKNQNYLPIYEKYFMLDTLIFKDIQSDMCILRNRKTGRAIRVEFPDAQNLMIWHKPGAPFLCLEPWNGTGDRVDSNGKLEEKEGIIPLPTGEEYHNTHTITLLGEDNT